MIATIKTNSKSYKIDFSKPIDISIPLKSTKHINAWGLNNPNINPIQDGEWVGAVKHGAPINCNTIVFNPHGHCTHTECVGHITKNEYSVNQALTQYLFLAEVITVPPQNVDNDFVITKKQLQFALGNKKRDAVIVRTIPNTEDKKETDYSNTNPPYFSEEAALYLKSKDVKHWLTDLPSVDKEQDDGKLLAHNAFWNTSGTIRHNATITELVFVPNKVEDGTYIVQLNVAAFENNATPSKPVLYKIEL